MAKKNEIVPNNIDSSVVVYTTADGSVQLNVQIDRDTVWLSLDQMAELFGRDKSVIGKHVRTLFREGELQKDSVWAKFAYTASDGKVYQVDFYNLDVIISVGYRVHSLRGTQFRIWATQVLKTYMLQGAVIRPTWQEVEYHVTRQLEEQNNRILRLEARQDEQQHQLDFFIQTSTPPAEMVFMQGEFFTARVALEKLIKTAQKRVVIVDNYVDAATFEMLDVRSCGVEAIIYTNVLGTALLRIKDLHNAQSGKEAIYIYQCKEDSHDRWIIVDDSLYHCGPSLKDAGRKIGAITRMGTSPNEILDKIM